MSEVRVSSYAVLSSRLEHGGHGLLNGRTGAVDVVSDEVAAVLVGSGQLRRSQGRQWDDDLSASAAGLELDGATMDALTVRGHLTSLSEDAERDQVIRLAQILHDVRSTEPVFLFVPNLDCNYRCTYCFERPVQQHLDERSRQHHNRVLIPLGIEAAKERNNVVMTKEQVDAAFTAMRQLRMAAGKDPAEPIQVILYGGEPLDAANEAVVRAIVERGRDSGVCFAAITNGHHVDVYLDLFGPTGITQVQISIDGPKRVHDRRRIYRGKESSFDRITRNIDLLLDTTETMVQIRVHVDPGNLADFDEILQFFSDRGWTDNSSVVVYANTVYEKQDDGVVRARIENADITAALEERATQYRNVFINAASVNARMTLLPALMKQDPFRLISTYCAANTGQYIFAPDGYMYACWESVGKETSRVGRYDGPEGVEIFQATADKWFNRHSGRIDECSHCPFALVCGGGCAQYAEYKSADAYKPYCDDFDGVYRAAMARTINDYVRRQERLVTGGTVEGGLFEQVYG